MRRFGASKAPFKPQVAQDDVRSKTGILLLLINCLLLLPLFEFCVWSLIWYAVSSIISSDAIILMRKRERTGCFTLIVFLM